MRKLKLLAFAAALVLVFCACNKNKDNDNQKQDSLESITEETQELTPQITQTARTRPQTTDELYRKWTELGVVDTDNRYNNVTCSEVCVFLNRILNYDYSGIHHYIDIFRDDSYYSDIMAIDAAGILTGSGGYFYPEEGITRERAIVALVRAFGQNNYESAPTDYLDDASISDWARSACCEAEDRLWYVGDTLRPQEYMTQEEFLWMLERIINDVVSGGTLSGTYTSGIVVSGGEVIIQDAEIYGDVYINAGQEPAAVKIINSKVYGSVFMGRGISTQCTEYPELTIQESVVGNLYCEHESNVVIDGCINNFYLYAPSNIYIGDSGSVEFMLADASATVTGGGNISLAIITYEATGSSFTVAPKVYLDAPGAYYSGSETGFVDLHGNTYLVGENGELYTGFVKVDGNEYYLDEDGILAYGLQVINGVSYLFDDNGVLQSGFKHIDDNTYYYDVEGNMFTGRHTIDGYDYIFDDEGILQKGVFTYEQCLFIADSEGRLLEEGIAEYEGETYAVDAYGKLITGLVAFEGEYHWFDAETGAMLRNTQVEDYIIDENGIITNYEYRISSGDEELDAALDEIVDEVCTEDMTLEEKMWAVYSWTKTGIHYRSTAIDLSEGYTQELVIEHGRNTLDTRRGACEHFAIVNALLFNRLGVETILIQGERHSLNYGDWSEHTWVLAKTDDLWYHYDALFEYSNLGIDKGVFGVTDEVMSEHHTWNADEYPVCDGVTTYTDD